MIELLASEEASLSRYATSCRYYNYIMTYHKKIRLFLSQGIAILRELCRLHIVHRKNETCRARART